MSAETALLLFLSVSASTARGALSKKLGSSFAGRRRFFFLHFLLFSFAAWFVFLFRGGAFLPPRGTLLSLSLAYGALTVLAQAAYTAALRTCDLSLSGMIYSFGFLIPTLFGTFVYREAVTPGKAVSLVLVLFTIVLAARRPAGTAGEGLSPLLFLAMAASGGLGVVQKIEQRSGASDAETAGFFLTAFLFAAWLCLPGALIPARIGDRPPKKNGIRGALSLLLLPAIGAAMALANSANTALAGKLPSAVAFPVTNVGVIVASVLLSLLFFGEKPTGRRVLAIALGLLSVLLFSL